MTFNSLLLTISILLLPKLLFAKLKVVTTTANAAALVTAVGGEHVEVFHLIDGTKDPHYADAKPSFVMRVSRADLLVSVGLGLEDAWLNSVLSGARNSKVMPGGAGSLILGKHIKPLEVVTGDVSREHGDVHPDGNPHFLLDPIRSGQLASVLANKLIELRPDLEASFKLNAENFKSAANKIVEESVPRVKKARLTKVFTYHKTLNYFLKRTGVGIVGTIEPKPGVPPTAGHILSLIKVAKSQGVTLALIESFFDTTIAERIKKDITDFKVKSVPVSVVGTIKSTSLLELYKDLFNSLL